MPWKSQSLLVRSGRLLAFTLKVPFRYWPVRNARALWYIGKRGGQLKLPENTKTAVQIVAEGGSVATGELRGGIGQRQEFWSIFQFQPADQVIPALREGKTLRVKGDDKLFPAFTLPIAADIIKALDRCIRR